MHAWCTYGPHQTASGGVRGTTINGIRWYLDISVRSDFGDARFLCWSGVFLVVLYTSTVLYVVLFLFLNSVLYVVWVGLDDVRYVHCYACDQVVKLVGSDPRSILLFFDLRTGAFRISS